MWRAVLAALALATPTSSLAAASASAAGPSARAPARHFRLAIVGDVHGQWDEGDASALRFLRPAVDACLFVGDFGDEDVVSVEAVARTLPSLPGAHVSVFGNHDAWFSLDKRKRRPRKSAREFDGQTPLDAQRSLLKAISLEYGKRELPELGLSIVGGRPYSIGGPIWPAFYVDQFGLTSPVESADRIGRTAARADEASVIFLAHNGPAGLGEAPGDICGRDWPHRQGKSAGLTGGDWGDRDLSAAVALAQRAGKAVPLVAFGHLHRRLIGGGLREMVRVDASSGTVYLNAAEVPRHRGPGVAPLPYDAAEAAANAAGVGGGGAGRATGLAVATKQHWFALVDMIVAPGASATVERVAGCWVEADGTVANEELWYCAKAGRVTAAGAGSARARAARAASATGGR
jgi:uncharacterized protein (TIGR04168 family)